MNGILKPLRPHPRVPPSRRLRRDTNIGALHDERDVDRGERLEQDPDGEVGDEDSANDAECVQRSARAWGRAMVECLRVHLDLRG
jgi:hypothetical protein